MVAKGNYWKLVNLSAILILFITILNFKPLPVLAQQAQVPVVLNRMVELEKTGIQKPIGLTFNYSENSFIVFGEVGSKGIITLNSVKLFEQELAGTRVVDTKSRSISNFIFDVSAQTVIYYDNSSKRIISIQSDRGAWLSPKSLDISTLGISSVLGLSVDPHTHDLKIVDTAGSQLIQLSKDPSLGWQTGKVASRKSISGVNLNKVKAVAIHPITGNTFLLTMNPNRLYELSLSAQIKKVWDLDSLSIADVSGMVFAPSGDPTDDQGTLALNILDSGAASNMTSGQDAKILEISLEPMAIQPLAETLPAAIVRSVQLSLWNPPSPDSSGIAFWPATGGLLISDSEVDQLPIFTGKNAYFSTLLGTLTGTCSLTWFTIEPTGAAINYQNGHIFFSSDDAGKVYQIDLGPDLQFCTADDSVTSINTRLFNSFDPEGIAFGEGKLIIADGTGREVYIVSPGTNGIFDSIAPTGDDIVSNFDTYVYNMTDPEGIEYNPDRGTIYVVGNSGVRAMLELDFSGNLITSFDLTSLPTTVRSGLAYGPASDGSGAHHFYLVSRGVDDGTDPNENDGMLYEINTFQSSSTVTPTAAQTITNTTTPDLTTTFTATHTSTATPTMTQSIIPTNTSTGTALPNTAPLVEAGHNQSTILPGTVLLDGTASDDGRPDPPHLLTTTWSKVSGPGVVSFSDSSAVDTIAEFSLAGTYVLQLSANDGELTSSDNVTIVVMQTGVNSVFEKRIAAGNDDAEETASGTMVRTSSTLELVTDATVQTVGLYYSGLNIPPGAKITNAYIQFKTAKKTTIATSLLVKAQAAVNPTTFASTLRDISSRPRTASGAAWIPPSWNIVGEIGVNQRTSNLSAVVQEIVNQPGWAIGNSVVFIITGSGKRVAKAYNSDVNGAPLLHVEFQPSETTSTPSATSTFTNTPSRTPTATVTKTYTPSATITNTPTFTSTNTFTPTTTSSLTFTNTPTLVFTDTNTPEAENTPTDTESPTNTATNTPEAENTPTDTETPTNTATHTGSTAYSFVSMGDAQFRETNFTRTVNQISLLNPDIVLFNGDLENVGFVAAEIDPMVSAIKNSGIFNKTFLVRGNHDDENEGSAALWETYFETEPNIKDLPNGVRDYVSMNSESDTMNYSFVYGNAIFIGLDVPGAAIILKSAQYSFLDDRLTFAENQGLTHAFIFWHGPMYCVESIHCTCSEKTDETCTPANLVTLINNHPIISAFFHGHEHILGWVHMDDTRLAGLTTNFEEFITSPSGGYTYNSYLFPDRVDFAYPDMDSAQGFASITVDGNSFTYNIYKVGDTLPVWSKTFTKPGAQPTSTSSPTETPTETPTPTIEPSATPTYVPEITDTPTPTFVDSLTPTLTSVVLNTSPMVNAGADQSIVLPGSISLSGSVNDDGLPLPPGSVSSTWSKVSGPGTVTFASASQLSTTVQFSTAGTYILRLSAYDGELTAFDDITIRVGQVMTYEVRIVDNNDEAEEFASGWVYRTSTDLELVYDSSLQTVGLRFRSIPIPQGAQITNAYIQFTVDSATSEATVLNFKAQAADNPGAFTSTTYDVSKRPVGTQVTVWEPVAWSTAGQAGLSQRTPNLNNVVAEVVNRPGWLAGNSMVFIITGSGKRVAVAYYGSAAKAPLLHIEYISYQ